MFLNNKLFAGIPPEILATFEPWLDRRDFDSGSIIVGEDATSDCMYLIGSGTVRISKAGRGTQQETLSHLYASDFFGEMGVYAGDVRSARATAEGPVVLAEVNRTNFEAMLKAAPVEMVGNLLRENVNRLRNTNSQFIREKLEAERMSLIGSMLSTIVHDIRGPLSVISLATELLAGDATPDQRARFPEKIRRSIGRIVDMTQELLDFSSGRTGLILTRVSPRELLEELQEDALPPLLRPGLEVDVDVEGASTEPMSVDRSRFFRLLQNIVKNSVEAMPDGGTLRIRTRREEGNVIFEISDTGKGIPPEILPTIFEPFMTHGKAGGTGLGMAIARTVVEAHGGRIEVESQVGEGTRFTITIPA